MFDFTYQNPVIIHFGKDSLKNLPLEIKKYGSTAMLVYGGESLKKYGHYQKIVDVLLNENIKIIDFGGNTRPSYQRVLDAIQIAQDEHVDVILGIGGSSVMDMAKIIGFGVKNKDLWSFLSEEKSNKDFDMLPVGEIPTYPSGGSEVDSAAEIDYFETGEHGALYGKYPKFAILYPEFSYSVSPKETTYGALVAFAQLSSSYFGGESSIADGLIESVLKQVLLNLDIVLNKPNDYDARANLMWASALNTLGILNRGKKSLWSIYASESIAEDILKIQYRYAIAIIFPKWLKAIVKHYPMNGLSYMKNVMHVDPLDKTDQQIIEEGLIKLENMFKEYGIATSYKEFAQYEVNDQFLDLVHQTIEEDDVLSKQEVEEMFVQCL